MAEIVSRQQATVNAGNKMAPHEALGIRRIVTISSPATAAWAQNDTIASPVTLPVGTRIVGAVASHGAFGASVTLDIGLRQTDSSQTVIDADGIAAAIDVSSAGSHTAANNGVLADENAPEGYVTTAESNIYATLAGANPTDDVQLRIDVEVILPG